MFFKKQNLNNYLAQLGENYNFIKKFSKPKGELCGIKLEDLTDVVYDDLKHNVPDLFQKSEFDKAIHLILKSYKKNIKFEKVKNCDNAKKLLFLLWVNQQYEKINELENTYLFSPPESKMLQAGIQELDVLGDVNTIDSLAMGDILKWKKIRKLKYSDVFNKMLKNTIENRINKKLIEINKTKK